MFEKYIVYVKYVCIEYLGSEKSKLTGLRLGVNGGYKHLDKNYDNVLGFGIPDLLLNLFSCQGFLRKNRSFFILKYPHRMFEYYFNKVFIIFNCDEKIYKYFHLR